MKNFPRKLDSKTSSLRITVPENLDLALEGLIRKVLKEQPKTDDIYSFAADYFETLLKIRDKAGVKYMPGPICSFHNDEDAHEMIKMANSFPKSRTGSDEGKDSGKSAPSGKSPMKKEPEKLKKKTRLTGDKPKRPVGRIKSTTSALQFARTKPITKEAVRPSPQEAKVLSGLESNLQDIDEDEEFLKSDPIKELVERELMSKTSQNDINRDKGQSSTDMTEKEKLESEKAEDKNSKVIEPHEDGKSKDELETTATGEELCAVVDVLSIPRAVERENETATNQNEENKNKVDENVKEKTEDGGEAIETPKPETEEAVKETNEPTPEKPEEVTDEKVKDLKDEKLEDDKIVKEAEGNEKREVKEDGDKPKESTDIVEEAKEEIKEIKDKQEDEIEDTKDQAKESAEDIKDKPRDAEDVKGTSIETEEADAITNKKEEQIPSEGIKVDIENKSKEDAEDVKVTPTQKKETDATTNKKEEEIANEKPKVEVTETENTFKTAEEAEKDPSNISQDASISIPDDSKKGLVNELEEKQEEKTTNQTSTPEENSPQEETPTEKPLTDSEGTVEKQEDKEIKTQLITDELLKTTEADDTPTKENKSEKDDECKDKVEEELLRTEEIFTSLGEGNKTTETDVDKAKAVNETQLLNKNQNEKPEKEGENVVPNDESLKETKEEVIEKKETNLQSESISEEVEKESAESKPEEETGIVSTKPDGTEKPSSETGQQQVGEPEKPEIIAPAEGEPAGDITEDESKSEITAEEAKSMKEKPEVEDQAKTEDKPEELKLETEQLSNAQDPAKVTETGLELKEDNKESKEPEQPKTEEEPEKELGPGSELKADVDTVSENTTPEVGVEVKSELDEIKETEMMLPEGDTKVDEEAIAVEAPNKGDAVKDEEEKSPNVEDESRTKTDETKQTEENIPRDRDTDKEVKEPETADRKIENETKEPTEEDKPEDIDKDKAPKEEKAETDETSADGELCTVVDTQNLSQPDETNKDPAKPDDGITIKTITTHYYDLLQVPTTVTKEFKVHRTQHDPLTPHNLSNVGNTIIKSYQLVKELTSDDNNNNNNPQTVSQDLNPNISSINQTKETEIEPNIPKDEIEDLTAIPTSGNRSELNLSTIHDLFLDSERKLSSYQKEQPKLSSLKNAKESLEDIKTQTETPKTPPGNEGKQEVEEIITKTVIPRIPEAVPDPPRDVEEINKESNTEETGNIKDGKPDVNSSDDSNEPTDSSNNGRSIDSDVPIISVEVRTVIETQILDDEEEDTEKGGDYRTELTLTDGSNDVNVEVEATIQVPLETPAPENQNLTDQEKSREQQKTKQQTDDKQEPPPEETGIKSSKEDSEAGGSSAIREGSSGESDSTTLTAATEIKRVDSSRKNFGRSSTQDLLTTQSLDSCKRPPLLKTRSLSVFRQGVTDFEIWNTIEKELEEAATKIQSKYRGYTVRKKLRREDAVQITTEESSVSSTSVEQELNLDEDNFRSTGEFHDSIVLSIHPR